VIAAATVAVVTAKLGPTSAAEQEAVEDRIDLREERLKQRQNGVIHVINKVLIPR
jgi:hypothetical protein